MEGSFNQRISSDISHASLSFPTILPEKLSLLIILILMIKFITTIFFKKRVISPLPPGPPPIWPILGCTPEILLTNKPGYRWIHRVMTELNTNIACFRLNNSHVVVLNSPEIAREFLTKRDAVLLASRPETMATHSISGGYLTTALNKAGEQWKKMRRILVSEIISHSKIHWLLDMRKQEADNLVRFLYNQCSRNAKGEWLHVRVAALHYPANTIRRMMFSRRHFGKGSADGSTDGGPGFEEEDYKKFHRQ